MLRRCCCATAVPIFPGEVPITPDGLRAKAFLPVRPAGPVDGVLERAGNRAVVLRRDEEHGVDRRDGVLESACDGREVGIVVVAVERQLAEAGSRCHLSSTGARSHQRQRQLAIDRGLRQAAHQISHTECRHVASLQCGYQIAVWQDEYRCLSINAQGPALKPASRRRSLRRHRIPHLWRHLGADQLDARHQRGVRQRAGAVLDVEPREAERAAVRTIFAATVSGEPTHERAVGPGFALELRARRPAASRARRRCG